MPQKQLAFFTSITANYISKTRPLAVSIKKHSEGAKLLLILSDKIPQYRSDIRRFV